MEFSDNISISVLAKYYHKFPHIYNISFLKMSGFGITNSRTQGIFGNMFRTEHARKWIKIDVDWKSLFVRMGVISYSTVSYF